MSTDVNTNTAILLPPDKGVTPVDPDFDPNARAELEREREVDCPELTTFLKRTCEAIKRERQAEWERIINAQVRCIAYYDDRQYGTVKDGVFQDARPEPGDIRPIDNQYKIQVDKLLMEFARSQSTIKVSAANKSDTRKAEAAKFAQARIDAFRKRSLKASERLREAQALLLKQMSYRYMYFNPQANYGGKERRPKKTVKTYGQTRSIISCKMCASPMKPVTPDPSIVTGTEAIKASNEYKCVNCGSNRQKELQLGPRQQEVVDGYEEVKGGCVESHHIDPMMVRISLSARQGVADSPFLWYHQSIARCILEDAYPEMRIKSAGGQPDVTDNYKRDVESAPSNAYAWDEHPINAGTEVDSQGGNQLEECPFDLFWLDPVMYRRVKFKKAQRLLGDREMPAGKTMGEMWPEGICVAINADQVLDVYGENKNKKWTFCVYGIREHALHGAGTSNLLGPQDTRNDLKAYLIANVYYNAARREFIRNGAITGNRLPVLNEAAIVNDVPADKPVQGWAYATEPGTPLPAQALELYASEAGSLQEGAGTSSLSNEGASADIKALGTATGVAAMRDQAVGRMGPNLMLLTEMEVETSFMVLEHELENFPQERFMSMANQAVTAQQTDGSITFTAEGIRAFMESEPRTDFVIEAEPGSWMPRTEAERQARFAAFAALAAEVAQKMPGDPRATELLAIAADVYGVDLDMDAWTATEQIAASRIRAYAKAVEAYERRGAPLTPETVESIIASTPDAMIDDEMDNHPLFMGFYRAWWASDEGASCSPLLKAVIKAVHILHRQGVVYQGQQRSADELKAEAPKQEAAAAMAEEAAQMADQPPKESLSYKDAPPAIRRQMEAAAGYDPAVDDDGGAGAETAAEAAKVEGQMMVQEHKAELEADADMRKAQLDVEKEAAKAQLAEQRAEGDHDRALEEAQVDHQHDAGMEHARMAHESAETASDRVHEERLSDKEAARDKNAAKKK